MRNLNEVLGRIDAELENHAEKECVADCRADLVRIAESACYAAPECMPTLWRHAYHVMCHYLPQEGWVNGAGRIWAGEE